VEGGTDEEDHSGSPMHAQWYFDPAKPCNDLEQDQDHERKQTSQLVGLTRLVLAAGMKTSYT